MLLRVSSATPGGLEPDEERIVTWGDRIFNISSRVHGLRSRSTPNRWRRLEFALVLLIVAPCYLSNGILYLYWSSATRDRRPQSLSDITISASVVWFTLSTVYVLLVMRMKNTEIAPLLQRNGRRLIDTVLFILLALPECMIVTKTTFTDKGFLEQLTGMIFLVQYFNMVIFFGIYKDIADALTEDLERLRRVTMDSMPRWEYLISVRWKIRDRIRTANSVFSVSLSFFYVQGIMTTVYVAAELTLQEFGTEGDVLICLSHICYFSKLIILASKASKVRSLSKDLERDYLEKTCNIGSVSYIHFVAARTYKAQEDWDTMTVGCFSHNLQNFWRFVSVLTTCVAVVLQFDYRVVRMINDSADAMKNVTRFAGGA